MEYYKGRPLFISAMGHLNCPGCKVIVGLILSHNVFSLIELVEQMAPLCETHGTFQDAALAGLCVCEQ